MPIESIADLFDSTSAFREGATELLATSGLSGPLALRKLDGARLLAFAAARLCAGSAQGAVLLHYVITEAVAEYNKLHAELSLPGPKYPERT